MTEPHSPRKLLVVDDDPFVHRQVRHIVGREFAVTSILSTNKATDAMLESLDTLVLDLNLPDGDAIGFMQDLGARAQNMHLILISGLETKTLRLTASVARQLDFRSVEIAGKPLSGARLSPCCRRPSAAGRALAGAPTRRCPTAACRWNRNCTGHWRATNSCPISSRSTI